MGHNNSSSTPGYLEISAMSAGRKDEESAFTLTGLTVGSCADCGAQSTALTSSGRCLLCRRHGEAMVSLESSDDSPSVPGPLSAPAPPPAATPPPPPPAPRRTLDRFDLESGAMPSVANGISAWSVSRSIRSLTAGSGDNNNGVSNSREVGGGGDTDEESWADINLNSPVATSRRKGMAGGGVESKKKGGGGNNTGSGRGGALIIAVMALGCALLIVAVVIGVLVSQGKTPFSVRDANANSALGGTEGNNIDAPPSIITTTAATETTVTTTPVAEISTTASEEEVTTTTKSSTTTSTTTVSDVSTTTLVDIDSTTSTGETTTTPESTEPAATATTTTAADILTTSPEDESTTSSTTASTATTTTEAPTTTTTDTTTTTTSTTTTTTRTTTTTPTTTTSTTTTTATTTTTTAEYFPSEPVPSPPPPGYFNYDPSDALHGPSSWGSLTPATGLLSTPEYIYWSRYQHEVKRDLTENMCGTGDTQSPIDVRMDIIRGYRVEDDGEIHLPESGEDLDMDGDTDEYEEGICYEHHEIRTSSGRTSLQSDVVIPQILPNKLRLVYDPSVASAADMNATLSALPGSDFPHQWGGRIDLKHIDVHIPSQHKVEGREFPAEYQLWHLHPKRRRAAVVSIMVDVHPEDRTNHHFNRALAEWQKVWEKNFNRCERRSRRTAAGGEQDFPDDVDARMGNPFGASTTNEKGDEEATYAHEHQRDLSSERWNPYDKHEIMRSIHFYGYSGSLTEPPCSDFVEWHIMDKPMLISSTQLRHLKYLLFMYRDDNCVRTGVHHEGSAARRPLMTVDDEEHGVHRCTCHDFLSDEVRRADANVTRCTKSEEQDELWESLDALLS